MGFQIDWDTVNRIVGFVSGAGFLTFCGILVNKMMAGGDKKLDDRRANRTDALEILKSERDELRKSNDECERERARDSEIRHAQAQQLQIWVFRWDELRKTILRCASVLRAQEAVPMWMLEEMERTPRASEVMSSSPPPSSGESEKAAE